MWKSALEAWPWLQLGCMRLVIEQFSCTVVKQCSVDGSWVSVLYYLISASALGAWPWLHNSLHASATLSWLRATMPQGGTPFLFTFTDICVLFVAAAIMGKMFVWIYPQGFWSIEYKCGFHLIKAGSNDLVNIEIHGMSKQAVPRMVDEPNQAGWSLPRPSASVFPPKLAGKQTPRKMVVSG